MILSRHQKWKQAHPERVKFLARLHKVRSYGLTLEQFEDYRKLQNYRCAICGKEEWEVPRGVLSIDHDHKTKKIRGLLCVNCNAGLGLFFDDLAILQQTIKYLRCN